MIMKSPYGIRLWILIAAPFLVGGGTICGLSSAWQWAGAAVSFLETPKQ